MVSGYYFMHPAPKKHAKIDVVMRHESVMSFSSTVENKEYGCELWLNTEIFSYLIHLTELNMTECDYGKRK